MELNRTSLIIGLVGLIVGVLLGMALFWGPLAVEWTDAQPYHLAPEARAEYVALVADSYKLDPDKERAMETAQKLLDGWSPEERAQAFDDAIEKYEGEARPDKVEAIDDLATVMGIGAVTPEPGEEVPEEEEAPKAGLWERIRGICLVFVIVLLVLVLAWIGYRLALRRRQAAQVEPAQVRRPPAVPRAEEWEGIGQPPLGHFFTTYELGEDTYDESFSIETPMGEFLGECGVGISETIGVGEPDKVTAFEVWLFDKSDIRTVTKVLMSEYAFHNDSLRARLASKGEAVLVQPGSPFVLETSGLRVRVDVTELVYGEGELPPQSYFSKLTVELVATAKPTETDASAF
jgi:hypothetical protein